MLTNHPLIKKFLSKLFVYVLLVPTLFWAEMVCTAYTPHENGHRLTAMGTAPVEGRTIASDDLPLGTIVTIHGHDYIVEDRFGGGHVGKLDIFMNNYNDAIKFGRQVIMCKIEIVK